MTEYPLAVYVPQADSVLETQLIPKSAIVGTPQQLLPKSAIVGTPQQEYPPYADDDTIVVDYEGNKFGAANMATFADRCVHAGGRHVTQFPTSARMCVSPEEVLLVGWFDGNVVTVDNHEALASWLGCDLGDALDAELMRS